MSVASTYPPTTKKSYIKRNTLKNLSDELGTDFIDSYDLNSIDKARIQQSIEQLLLHSLEDDEHNKKDQFELNDIVSFLKSGFNDIIQDDFSRCFTEHEDNAWNWNIYLFPLWLFGLIIRYFILFPIRLLSLTIALCLFLFLFFSIKIIIPNNHKRSWYERKLIAYLSFVFVYTWTGVIRVHGVIPKKKLIKYM